MPKIVLIKPSLPTSDPDKPAASWQLAPEGVGRCHRLASCLADFLPAVLVSSREPKARATADRLAERFALTATTIDGLEEQHRMTAPFLTHRAFKKPIRQFFSRPPHLALP